MYYESFACEIQSDEFAAEWADYVTMLDAEMIQHMEEDNL